jgi:predicted transcriptional regulator
MTNLYDEITELYSNIEGMINDYDFCANHQIPDIDFTLYKMLGELKMAEIICKQMTSDELHKIISNRVMELQQQVAEYKA